MKIKIDRQYSGPTPEKTSLKLGFMPLTDCAPLIAAKELGFFELVGLDVELCRQTSWAAVRDKLSTGMLDASQMLAPMPLALSAGLAPTKTQIETSFCLSRNGNAVTLSKEIFACIQAAQDGDVAIPMNADVLTPIAKQFGRKLRFASVFSYSCHYYLLRKWFEQGGVDASLIEHVVLPPQMMVDALAAGEIDGYCVGGPWNANAVRRELGATVVASDDIWPNGPEKMLGVESEWAAQNPNTHTALMVALLMASKWLTNIPNRFEIARILAQPEYINSTLDIVAPSLLGSCPVSSDIPPRSLPSCNRFYSDNSNLPDEEHGHWLVEQMQNCGQLSTDIDVDSLVSSVYKPDAYHVAEALYLADFSEALA